MRRLLLALVGLAILAGCGEETIDSKDLEAKLRTQLEPKPHDPRYLVTVHGTGYQLLM